MRRTTRPLHPPAPGALCHPPSPELAKTNSWLFSPAPPELAKASSWFFSPAPPELAKTSSWAFSPAPPELAKTSSCPLGRAASHLTALPLVALAMVFLAACSISRATLGDEFKTENIEAVKKGTSTRAEVVTALGAPDRVLQINGQEVFQYYRYDAKVSSLLLIVANFSRLQIKSDDLYVWFTREGIVQDLLFGKRTDKMKFRFWPFGD